VTAQEALTKWDAGEVLWTIEMGGIGPSYEQAIHLAVFEIIRAGGDADKAALQGLGLSGAQAGAAKSIASRAIEKGWDGMLATVPADRKIMVEKRWPSLQVTAEAIDPSKDKGG